MTAKQPPAWLLRRLPAFRALPEPKVRALAEAVILREFSRAAIVYRPGDNADHVYCLHGGRACALVETRRRTITVGEYGPGAVFGESCLWAPAHQREDTVVTTTPALLSAVPRVALRLLLDEHPEVERALMAETIARQEATARRLCDALGLSVRARVAGQLLRFAESGRDTPDGRRFTLPLRQREFGELIGSTRESVHQELTRLEREAIIARSGRQLLVRDLDQLRALVQDERAHHASQERMS